MTQWDDSGTVCDCDDDMPALKNRLAVRIVAAATVTVAILANPIVALASGPGTR